jgi:hypothetical protein
MRSGSRASARLSVILALAATSAVAAVPEPLINGVVVQDVTRAFSFDRIGSDVEGGDFIDRNANQGTVQAKVIQAPDHTFDFYFHFTTTSGVLKSFSYLWQAPVSYTVAYHVTDAALAWAPAGPSAPAPGFSASGARGANTLWTVDENGGGALHEGIFVLDTDAAAYASTASYQIGDSVNRIRGFYDGSSPLFATFGPAAVPEPETYVLMLSGLGLLALARRAGTRRHGARPAA